MPIRIILAISLLTLTLLPGLHDQATQNVAPKPTLQIHYIDVEGGAATLIVTPAKESILIDAGWPVEGRDAGRIQRAMAAAGIASIDHLVITHYHTDHYGGVPQLAGAVKIHKFYDHGPMDELAEDVDFAKKYVAYRTAAKDKTITLRPGDEIKLRRASRTPPISLRCLASNGVTINDSRQQGRENSECLNASLKAADPSDNARSIVLWLRFGDFDFFDAGDLTWNVEHRLVCPSNSFGQADLYQVTHHGLNNSNNPVVMRSLKPTVAIMNNGPRKGGHPETVRWLKEIPSLKALYQLHLNVTAKVEENAPADFIANLTEANDEAHAITVLVDPQTRSFSVNNGRTGITQSYPIK